MKKFIRDNGPAIRGIVAFSAAVAMVLFVLKNAGDYSDPCDQ